MTSRIMAHMVASYPDRARSLAVARAIVDGGASLLEVQFPFSDPMADGPDIQAACARALEAGFTVDDGFRLIAEIASTAGISVFIMSYANLLFARGIERFLRETREAGGAGVIVPDLPPDYDEGLFTAARSCGIEAVPVLSPSMSDARIARVAALGGSYVYATLRTGITGTLTSIAPASIGFLEKLAGMRPAKSARSADPAQPTAPAAPTRPAVPGQPSAPADPVKILGGFGIATREQVIAVQDRVYAVVVGSALVREVAKSADGFAAVTEKLRELAGS